MTDYVFIFCGDCLDFVICSQYQLIDYLYNYLDKIKTSKYPIHIYAKKYHHLFIFNLFYQLTLFNLHSPS